MPLLTSAEADFTIIIFTIFWGIIIETRFVSKWTIIFNAVPLITLLSTIDFADETILFLIGYALGSIVLALCVPQHQEIKQLVGAKGYGSLSLSFFIVQFVKITPQVGSIPKIELTSQLTNMPKIELTSQVIILWVIIAVGVYFLWWRYKKWKDSST